MPTAPKTKKILLDVLPKNISHGNIYEVGSGWGTLASPLAKLYPQCSIIAYETSPVPFWFSKCRFALMRHPNLQIIKRDFFQEPLNDAVLIVCYLYPEAMRRLKIKFEKELQPGTYVITNTFAIPGWKPELTREVPDLYHTKIYVYRIPLKS